MSLNAVSVGTIWAQSLSLNNLVRPQKEGLGDLEADGLGGPHVDDQLELRGLLHGQVRGLGPFQDFVHVGGGAPEVIQEDRRVGHEATGVPILPQSVYRRQPVFGCKTHDACSVGKGQRVLQRDESTGALPAGGFERAIEIVWPPPLQRLQRHSQRARSSLRYFQIQSPKWI